MSTAEVNRSLDAAHSGDGRRRAVTERRLSLGERVERFISRLSTRNNFWHKVCSLIWLPYAFRSGISMRRVDSTTFTAVLPFKRINRNWYNAMAGAALLANSEVAGGMYLFSACGGEYIVVCKQMHYKFLRPCLGPAVYHVANAEDVLKKIEAGGEFNIDLELEIRQQLNKKKDGREKRVGRCFITFHCTPKEQMKQRAARLAARAEQAQQDDGAEASADHLSAASAGGQRVDFPAPPSPTATEQPADR